MSIKLRVALVFTLALAVAFALGAWLFIAQLSAHLLNATDVQLLGQISAAGQYAPGGSARSAGGSGNGGDNTTGEYLVQVIDRAGHVVGSSPDTPGTPMISAAQIRRARLARATPISLNSTIDGEQTRILAGPLAGHPGWVAVAGISLDTEHKTVSSQRTLLIIGGAVFVLLGGLGSYWLAASALSPVERMRREVAALSERDASGGVRVPRTRDELAALAGTMNALLARLHGALDRQRGFVADASHELRTPLAVLGAELELAGRPGRSRDELAAAVGSAEHEVARLTRITNDLLTLARSDEGRLPVRLAPTDVRALLERSAQAADGRAAAGGVTGAGDVPAGLVRTIDEDRIRQAVDNLVANALRFAPAGSQVTLSARAAGAGLEITVADTGPGFPADFLPHAFERFRRPDSGRARSDGGAGLGLAIVAAIAGAHGGTATARNNPAGGAAVSIELPGAASPAG